MVRDTDDKAILHPEHYEPLIYGGIAGDLECLYDPSGRPSNLEVFCLIDLPLSLVVDTVAIPYVLYRNHVNPNVAPTERPMPSVLVADSGKLVELAGIARRDLNWSPHSFGEHPETGARFTIWMLTLDHPTVVKLASQVGKEMLVREVAVSIAGGSNGDAYFGDFSGRRAAITGKLWTAVGRGGNTPLVLEALKFQFDRASP